MISSLFADAADYRVGINATNFVSEITTDTPLGTEIIKFRVVVQNEYFNNPQAVLLSIVRNDQTERIFKLENGANDEDIFYGVLDPRPFPEHQVIIIERGIIYDAEPPEGVVLPATFDFDINVVVVARSGSGLSPPFEDAMARGDVTVMFPPGKNTNWH